MLKFLIAADYEDPQVFQNFPDDHSVKEGHYCEYESGWHTVEKICNQIFIKH